MWDKGWDELFSRVEWGRYPGEELIRFIARTFYKAPDRKAVRILEVGCGTGANLWFLAREGFSAYGLDGSQIAIKRAEVMLNQERLSAELRLGDAMNLPFEDSYFDAVLDVECLYANSMKDTEVILNEIHRVLKPGGWIYSKTFSTGMSGESSGLRMEGEPNTFIEMPDGPLHKDYGIIRLTSEEDIKKIYRQFFDLKWDRVSRTDLNRTKEISEWVIQGQKRSGK